MESECQFREVQKWSRLLSWPLIAVGGVAVATFAQDTVDSDFRWIVQTAAIAMIPVGWLLLEFAGPRLEVTKGRILYSIWPFYRKEIELTEVLSLDAKTFHPPGNYVSWFGRGFVAARTRSVPDTHYVELRLRDGSVIDITTLEPNRLAEAIRKARALGNHEARVNGAVSL
jgi:hypothetical protein